MSFSGPLFIIGMPRSGTKLLRTLLNNHSEINLLDYETEFFPYIAKNIGKFGDLSNRSNFHRFYQRITKFPYFLHAAERQRLISETEWHGACRSVSAAGVFEALIRHDSGCLDSPIVWGDKSPSYIRQVPLLAAHFPSARVIHIVRDVRDYVISLNRGWGKHLNRAAQRWADDVGQADRDLRASKLPYLQIRYEDLLSDPERHLRGICDWLELSYREDLLTIRGNIENRGSGRGMTGIVSNNFGKYKSALSIEQQRMIESIAGPVLEQFGYPLDHNPPVRRLSRSRLLLTQLADGCRLVLSQRRQGGWLRAVRLGVNHFVATRF